MPENVKRIGARSKEEAAVASSPSLDGTMDLLTEEEENIILAVIKRDEMERSIINAKIIEVRKEIQEIRQAGALTAGDDLNVICARCKFKFPPFLLPWADHGQRCVSCKFRVCAKCCGKEMNGSWLCILCSKYRQEKLLTGDWILRGGQVLQQQQRTSSQPVDLFGSDLLRASLKEKNVSGSQNEAFRKHRSQNIHGDVRYTPAELMAVSSDEPANHETAVPESTGSRSSWWKETTNQGQKDADSETQEVGGYDGDTSSLGSEPQPHVVRVSGGLDDCLDASSNLDDEHSAQNISSISEGTHSKMPSALPSRFRFGKTSSSLQENADRNNAFNNGPEGEISHASTAKSSLKEGASGRTSASAEEDVESAVSSKYTKVPISCTADQAAKKKNVQNLDRVDSFRRGQSEKRDSFDDIYNSSVSMFVQTMPDAVAATVCHQSAAGTPRRVLPERPGEGLLRHSGGRHVSDGGREPTGRTDHHLAVPVIAVTNAGVQGVIEDEEEEDNLDEMFSNHQPSQLLSSRSSLSSHSSLTDSRESLYSVYSDAGEVNYGRIGVTGEIQFNLSYNQRAKILEVHIQQCKSLAPVDVKHNRSDPYVKTYLLPDKSRASKRKTRIKKHTLNPVFNEILKYQISSLLMQSRSLWVTVWHNDRFGRNDFLGEVTIPLNYYDFSNNTPLWYPLQERMESQDSMLAYKGDIFISLKFVTADVVAASKNRSSTHKKNKEVDQPQRGELHVLVKEAQNLTAMRGSAGSDPFCKGYLLPDVAHSSKQKTPVVRRTTNPQWQHMLVFDGVDQTQLAEHGLELTVWDFERLSSNDFLGGVRLNLGQGTHFGRSVEWMDARGEEILAWKRMMDQPNQWVNVQLPLRTGMGKQNLKK